jgi:glycine/D-amino acid oxidase-like deaminating enzyme
MRILIVGAGILGAHHALAAAMAGHSVTMVDRYAVPRGASIRNLGAIRVSGRARGRSLTMSNYGLTRWRTIGERIPQVGFSACGSVTLLRDEAEIGVAEEYIESFSDTMNLRLVPGDRVASIEPAVVGAFPAALICDDDATIIPGAAMPSLIEYLRSAEGVDVRLGVRVRGLERVGSDLVASTTARDVHADAAFVCTGDAMESLFSPELAAARLRAVRIHAFEIAHRGVIPSMIVTDGSALRSYPGYLEMVSASALPVGTIPGSSDGEWVVTPSAERSLLVGDTRHDDDRSGAPMPPESEQWLVERCVEAFGADARFVRRRWSAGFVESGGDVSAEPYVRIRPMPGVELITGLGLMGNTLAPAVARESIAGLSRA